MHPHIDYLIDGETLSTSPVTIPLCFFPPVR